MAIWGSLIRSALLVLVEIAGKSKPSRVFAEDTKSPFDNGLAVLPSVFTRPKLKLVRDVRKLIARLKRADRCNQDVLTISIPLALKELSGKHVRI
ncbi:hypothetical protein GYMLUDRAFT_75150 [Collybiopsis luxurians FD-317 M1]|uniref:Uncharacterized protein n=1 Tax=Collybiopsis luxurians FD-317 M1 TaxID=944289 RepID=A0A0D0C6H6_9AGAR|nr:hypothetical protein GYMLUDRAFT_75150 [Collybiopsis luxurians FD-317 M1]